MKKNIYHIPLFCIVTAFYWFSLYVYVPILSPYAESLGASYKMVGLIVGSYGFTQMLLRIPLGIISDRINNRKLFIIAGMLFSLISSLGMWLFKNVSALLIFRSLSGVAAASWVAYTVLFSSYFAQQDAPKALGIINSFNALGQMLAMFLGGFAAQHLGQQSTFFIAALGGSIGLILSLTVFEKKSLQHESLSMPQLFVVAKDGTLLLTSGLAVLAQFLTFATVFGFTPVAAKNIGANDVQLGLLTTFSTLPTIFASAASGSFFSRRYGEKKTIIASFLLIALSCITIPFIRNINLLYLSQIVGGFGRGLLFPLLMGLSIKSIENSKRATAMGFFQAIYGIGMFLGPVITGIINDIFGLFGGFWLSGAIGVIGALLSTWRIAEK